LEQKKNKIKNVLKVQTFSSKEKETIIIIPSLALL
jgi:hypothetical protein|tara:strand:+ start:46 stop:150 length:105 start_codon:yes stop_codon:yes gene_type:complete